MLADGRIEVEGRAERRAMPDVAAWSARVVGYADGRRDAFAQAGERAAAVLAAVRALDADGLEAWSEPIAVHPRWEPGRKRPTGWEAIGAIGLRGPLDVASVAGQAALDAGAETLDGPAYELGDEDALREELLGDAVRAARRRAEGMARAVGAQLGRVLALDDVPADDGGGGPPMLRLALAEDADAPPLAPEALRLEVRVRARFELLA